jgi:hypothetical protein
MTITANATDPRIAAVPLLIAWVPDPSSLRATNRRFYRRQPPIQQSLCLRTPRPVRRILAADACNTAASLPRATPRRPNCP